jgi:hypothetical protein
VRLRKLAASCETAGSRNEATETILGFNALIHRRGLAKRCVDIRDCS